MWLVDLTQTRATPEIKGIHLLPQRKWNPADRDPHPILIQISVAGTQALRTEKQNRFIHADLSSESPVVYYVTSLEMYSTKILREKKKKELDYQSIGNSTLLGSGSVNDMPEILRSIILRSTEYGTIQVQYRTSTTDPWNEVGCNFPFLDSV